MKARQRLLRYPVQMGHQCQRAPLPERKEQNNGTEREKGQPAEDPAQGVENEALQDKKPQVREPVGPGQPLDEAYEPVEQAGRIGSGFVGILFHWI